MTRLPPGSFLRNNRYRIDGFLGQGGFGITYRAHDTFFNKPVAIKASRAACDLALDRIGPWMRRRLARSGRAASGSPRMRMIPRHNCSTPPFRF